MHHRLRIVNFLVLLLAAASWPAMWCGSERFCSLSLMDLLAWPALRSVEPVCVRACVRACMMRVSVWFSGLYSRFSIETLRVRSPSSTV